MITGEIKNKVNAIWDDFYNENYAQPSEIVSQLTFLMFLKMLDDKQNALEARAAAIGQKPNQKDLYFKDGDYINEAEGIRIPYENLRWKNFCHLNGDDMSKLLKNYAQFFLKDENNSSIGDFPKFAKKFSFGLDTKRRLLTSVVDKLSDPVFDFTKLDIMGDVYEYMCGSGVSGQFRTPRHIIDLAIEMMKPRIGQKIIDPAMGTAGFLVESARYIEDKQKAELLNVNNRKVFSEEMFYGCDNDDNMAMIGYMNNILHNVKKPTITTNSLLEKNNSNGYIGKFDLVLANPPFSGKLVTSATDGALLTITNCKNTELLFVALMSRLLKIGGKCMSVVPDGVLFGTDKAHKNLRIHLLDKMKLIAVISMPQGIFQAPSKKGSANKGTSVKTSFIVFENTGCGGTDKVWFYDMRNDGYSLGAKRTPIEENDIPDIINRFNNLQLESNRKRNDQSFMVDVDEIRKHGYDLLITTYKAKVIRSKNIRPVSEIMADINENQKAINNLMAEINESLKGQ